jgi:hypothetical protein
VTLSTWSHLLGIYLQPGTLTVYLMRIISRLYGRLQVPLRMPKINWDDKSILSSDPRTKETELQVQKIINLQNIANNLPDAFTDYKSVTKSWNPTVNVPERVEVPKKTTHAPSVVKRGGGSSNQEG